MARTKAGKSRWSGTGSERELQVDLRRNAVFATAARLFNERGYHETTLEDVANELHVTKAALYYYIKDKDEILFECQKLALRSLSDVLISIRSRDRPVVVRLREFLIAYGNMLSRDYGKCLIRTGIRQLKPASKAELMPFITQLDEELSRLIEEGLANGELRPNASRLIRNFAFGAFQGLTAWFKPTGEFSIEEVVDVYWEILSLGIVTDRQSSAANTTDR